MTPYALSGRLQAWLRRRLDRESKRLIRNSSWVFLANANSTLCLFARSIILARGLGPDLFGTLMLIMTLVKTLQELANLNLPTAVVKFGAEFLAGGRNDKLRALVVSFAGLTLVTLLVFVGLVYLFLVTAYDQYIAYAPPLTDSILIYAAAIGITMLDGLSTALLRLYDRFRLNSIIIMVTDWFDLVIVALVLGVFGPDVRIMLMGLAASVAVKSIVCNAATYLELRGALGSLRAARSDALSADWKPMRHFLFHNAPANTLQMLLRNGDVLLLGALASPAQVAYYSIAKRFGYSILRITDPLTLSVYPQIASLIASKQYVAVRKLLRHISGLLLVPVGCVIVLTALFGAAVLGAVYGAEYRSASGPLQVLLIAGGVAAVLFWTMPLVLSLGKVRLRLMVNLAAVLIAGPAGFALGSRYGATGIALAMLLATAIDKFTFLRVAIRALR